MAGRPRERPHARAKVAPQRRDSAAGPESPYFFFDRLDSAGVEPREAPRLDLRRTAPSMIGDANAEVLAEFVIEFDVRWRSPQADRGANATPEVAISSAMMVDIVLRYRTSISQEGAGPPHLGNANAM